MGPWVDAARALRARLPALPLAHPDGLSEREVEVLGLLAAGRANKEIASALFISVPTVERHVANIYAKTGRPRPRRRHRLRPEKRARPP